MTVAIYHNPKCGTSRKVLEMIRSKDIEPRIVLYLETPPTKAKLKELLGKMGVKPRDILRRRGTPYDELGLDDPKLSDERLLTLMTEHPILIERPIVETGKGVRLCRPQDKVREIL